MSRVTSIPVVALGKDSDGRPTRLSLPGTVSKPVPIRSGGRKIGEVARDGSVSWTPAGSAASFEEMVAISDGLDQAKWSRRRLRAALSGDKVVAVVVPAKRRKTAVAPRFEKAPGGSVLDVR
ncbi:MAG: hypothetical protein ACLFWH_05285 [Actinomycetota bacterium]